MIKILLIIISLSSFGIVAFWFNKIIDNMEDLKQSISLYYDNLISLDDIDKCEEDYDKSIRNCTVHIIFYLSVSILTLYYFFQ